jgi:hypothetical protein
LLCSDILDSLTYAINSLKTNLDSEQNSDLEEEGCTKCGKTFNPQAILFGKSGESDSEGTEDTEDADNTVGEEDIHCDGKSVEVSDKPAPGDVKTNTEANFFYDIY